MKPSRELIDEIERERIERARNTPPEEKILLGPRLFDRVCRIMRDGVRMQFPSANEEEVWRIFRERLAIAEKLERNA